MMIAALVALGFGATAGIFLATRHFLRKRMPASVALLHGLGGATGFTLVLLTVVREPGFGPIREVLYLLIATVVLGVVNLLFHIRKVRHRTSLIIMHGLTAVTSAAMLIRAIVLHAAPSTEAQAYATTPPASSVATPPPSAVPSAPAAPASGEPPADPAPIEQFAVDSAVQSALARQITFETKSARITQDSLELVVEIAGALKSHPEVTLVEVQGHADSRGDDQSNLELTRARAAAVVSALVERGVARERLQSAGYGARCPTDPSCGQAGAPESCRDPAVWRRDRRVTLVVLKVGKVPFHGQVVCEAGAGLIPPENRRFLEPGGAR